MDYVFSIAEGEDFRQVLTWPNVITFARLCAGVYGLYVATVSNLCIGAGIFAICGLGPDILDGWIARKYHAQTRFGEFFDPLADKILFYLAIFTLFSAAIWWPGFIVLFLCDICSTVLHCVKNGGAVKSGKYKFFLQNASLAFFLCGKLCGIDLVNIIANTVLLFATCCAVHSLWVRCKR